MKIVHLRDDQLTLDVTIQIKVATVTSILFLPKTSSADGIRMPLSESEKAVTRTILSYLTEEETFFLAETVSQRIVQAQTLIEAEDVVLQVGSRSCNAICVLSLCVSKRDLRNDTMIASTLVRLNPAKRMTRD